ncbi:CamS family sex pheromone protein [Lactobacillus selangorensis]|nr:CamS family sex pheromone protein [Lactobacillus selangorensis]
MASILLLAGCGNLKNSNISSSGTKSTTTKSGYQTTGQSNSSMYEGLIENGKYKTSAARGLTVSQDSNTYNVKSFESGLLTLSKKEFSTQDYIFQEGQKITKTMGEAWLGRQSSSDPNGLNPKSNGKTGETTRNPIYIQQIEEQDFVQQNGSKYNLGGISVGIGLNKTDYYTKKAYGSTYQTDIPTDTMVAKGKEAANKVVKRLRAKKSVGNDVPILIGLYQLAPQDSLVGGTYIYYGVAAKGSDKITSWHKLNEANYSLPAVEDEKTGSSGDATAFSNFKTNIQSFFPNLSGVTAQTHYEDGKLKGMNITINTQFYGETEIMSFTQYVATAANKYLPSGVDIEINIKTVQGEQAFLARTATQKKFYSHVFGSY